MTAILDAGKQIRTGYGEGFQAEAKAALSHYICSKLVKAPRVRDPSEVTVGELLQAAGIAVTNYIRHQLTDYEMLMHRFKLTREEARINEAGAVKELTAAWPVGAPERKQRKKRRRGRRKAKS